MELSNEQYKILGYFYNQTKIYIDELSKFELNKDSTVLASLVKERYLKPTDMKAHPNPMVIAAFPTSYTINEAGKRAYENYLAYLAQLEYDKQTLELQNRQVVSSEEAVTAAKESNVISRKSKTISLIALGISILSGVASIASAIIALIALIKK